MVDGKTLRYTPLQLSVQAHAQHLDAQGLTYGQAYKAARDAGYTRPLQSHEFATLRLALHQTPAKSDLGTLAHPEMFANAIAVRKGTIRVYEPFTSPLPLQPVVHQGIYRVEANRDSELERVLRDRAPWKITAAVTVPLKMLPWNIVIALLGERVAQTYLAQFPRSSLRVPSEGEIMPLTFTARDERFGGVFRSNYVRGVRLDAQCDDDARTTASFVSNALRAQSAPTQRAAKEKTIGLVEKSTSSTKSFLTADWFGWMP